jgi:small subunit ribosomal protein S20
LAVHKSAEKRVRQNETRRVRNRHIKTSIKTMVKRVREAVQEKNEVKAKEALARVIPLVDKAASQGVLHWRNRSRKISRLTRLVNTMGAKN